MVRDPDPESVLLNTISFIIQWEGWTVAEHTFVQHNNKSVTEGPPLYRRESRGVRRSPTDAESHTSPLGRVLPPES